MIQTHILRTCQKVTVALSLGLLVTSIVACDEADEKRLILPDDSVNMFAVNDTLYTVNFDSKQVARRSAIDPNSLVMLNITDQQPHYDNAMFTVDGHITTFDNVSALTESFSDLGFMPCQTSAQKLTGDDSFDSEQIPPRFINAPRYLITFSDDDDCSSSLGFISQELFYQPSTNPLFDARIVDRGLATVAAYSLDLTPIIHFGNREFGYLYFDPTRRSLVFLDETQSERWAAFLDVSQTILAIQQITNDMIAVLALDGLYVLMASEVFDGNRTDNASSGANSVSSNLAIDAIFANPAAYALSAAADQTDLLTSNASGDLILRNGNDLIFVKTGHQQQAQNRVTTTYTLPVSYDDIVGKPHIIGSHTAAMVTQVGDTHELRRLQLQNDSNEVIAQGDMIELTSHQGAGYANIYDGNAENEALYFTASSMSANDQAQWVAGNDWFGQTFQPKLLVQEDDTFFLYQSASKSGARAGPFPEALGQTFISITSSHQYSSKLLIINHEFDEATRSEPWHYAAINLTDFSLVTVGSAQ